MNHTEQLAELRRQRIEIERQIDDLEQQELAEKAIAPVGGMIEWTHSKGRKRRGRITSMREWLGKVAYVVNIVRADGSDGRQTDVYPYHNPERYYENV